MTELRLYSVFDSGSQSYLRPFWGDYKVNAQRSFRGLVNQKDDPQNNIAMYPDQFTLFELGVFDMRTGVFTSHPIPQTLGNGVEYKEVP